MNRATNSAYMGKGKQQMAKPQQQAAGSQQEQVKQQIKMIAQKLMQEKGMEKEQAVETAKQMIKQQMAQQSSEQEGMPEYNMGGTIGSAVGAVGGSIIPGVGTALGSTVGGAAGTLIGEAVGGDKNPEQYTGRKREQYDTLMNKSKGKDSVFYKHGGNINKAPGMKSQYEAEGGEVIEGEAPKVTGEEGKMKEQTDDTYVIKGPSHENGGVEGKGGNRVFSDSIKIPGTSQTYADAAKKIGSRTGQKSMEKKMEAKPYDQILKRSLNRTKQRNEAQKNKLFELQEQQKDVEGIDNNNQKMEYGGEVDTATSDYDVVEDENLPEFANGGGLPSQGTNKQFGYNVSGSGEGLTLDEKLENMDTMMGDTTSNSSSSLSKVPRETPTVPKIDNTPDPIQKRTDQDLLNALPEPESAYDGSATGPSGEMSPAQKNLYERMMQQQEKSDRLTPVSRAAQAIPAVYNLADSENTNYQKPQQNRMADDAISEIEDMPTNYNIQPQLNQISDSYDKITDQVSTYSASPQVARANMRQAFAKKLGAESQAYGKKENMENQMERQQAKALAQQKYQTGTQAAGFRDKANMLNLKTQAAADQQRKAGLSQLSKLAANIGAEEQKKLSELQRRNLNYELLGNSGVGSRMTSDANAIKYMMKNNPEYVKKYMPYVYKERMKNKKGSKKDN